MASAAQIGDSLAREAALGLGYITFARARKGPYRVGRAFEGDGSGVAESCAHGRPLCNEFCRERRQSVYFAVGMADIEVDVTAFEITERRM
jgi:hypothetical protein